MSRTSPRKTKDQSNQINIRDQFDPFDPLGLLDFFIKLDEPDTKDENSVLEEASENETQREKSTPKKCVAISRGIIKSELETDQDRSSEVGYEDSSSSGSSTVMSESLSHWASFNERDPWGADEVPPFKLSEYDQFDFTDEELEGVLTDRFIAAGLSFLSPCPLTCKYSLNKLKLPGKNIHDIRRLEKFCFIQYVDLSRNCITDVKALENLPFLMYLDVSSNKLNTLLSFKAPLNLTYVNYSKNELTQIDDLSDFWTIINLNLSHNSILKIEGLHNLRFLRILDLSFNCIQCIENIDHLRLSHLYLNNNEISQFEEGQNVGLKTLPYLQYINLDCNQLANLQLFRDTYNLEKISLVDNKIVEVFELESLKSLVNLKEINLKQNPITECLEYRQIILSTVPSVSILDTTLVTMDEKIEAKINLDPDERIVAARYHTLLLIMEQINNPVIEPHIIPVGEKPLPIVILVGPESSMKGHLTRFAAENLDNKVYAGISHTSRKQKDYEIDGVHYYFVTRDKMNEKAHQGHFISFTEVYGDSYGLDRHELMKAYEKECLCLTHMDIIGAIQIYNRGLKPHLVLVIAENQSIHLRRLKKKYKVSKPDTPCGSSDCNKDFCTELCKACKESSEMYKKKGARGDEAIFSDSFVDELVSSMASDAIRASKIKDEEREQNKLAKEMETAIQNALQTRKSYFQLQDKGFFSSTVNTDDVSTAYANLVSILKRVYHLVAKAPPYFMIENDTAFKNAIPKRMQHYMNELNRHNSNYN